MASSPAINRPARDKAIRRVERLLAGEKGVTFASISRARRNDRTLDELFNDLDQMLAFQLPTRPRGDDMAPSLRRLLERTALFLQTDESYDNPDLAPATEWVPILIAGAGGVLLFIVGVALQKLEYPEAGKITKILGGIGIGLWFARIVFLPYFMFLLAASINIFHVRVLRKDLDASDAETEDEHWPFATREQYERMSDMPSAAEARK